jgi:streptomycin 6-kinase
MFPIPESFVRKQDAVHGAPGHAWLARLPAILAACARRWGLTLGPPLPNLTWHYVAAAVRADGTPVVVKACSPTGEFARQVAALRLCAGHGAARLLAQAPEHEVMVLERLLPGTPLTGVADDEAATTIAIGVMRDYWRPVPPDHPFPSVADWADDFDRLRRHLGGPGGPGDPRLAALVAEARHLLGELLASGAPPVVLHGDLHHGNILSAGPRGWLAIDPKGLVGEPACEAGGSLLWNNLPGAAAGQGNASTLARRVAQLAAALGVERERVRRWGLVQGVLAGTWSVGKGGRVEEWAIAHAERLAALANSD